MTRVLVLGATGMLGSMVTEVLAADPAMEVIGSVRGDAGAVESAAHELVQFDARVDQPQLHGIDWVINCIGLIKQRMSDTAVEDVRSAIEINALFPMRLAEAAEASGTRVLQIATDCVFSGLDGGYSEESPHDAHDVYGKTKSLGEVVSPAVQHLRCSIVGPERAGRVSLLSWFLHQQPGSTVQGYRNHRWNGVTTLHFARLARAVIASGLSLPPRMHVIPRDVVSKAELLRHFASSYRHDVQVVERDTETKTDRTLTTRFGALNEQLWASAGYSAPPTIAQMVEELAQASFAARR